MTLPPFETAKMLADIQGIRHGFFGRRSGNGDELNMSETLGDDPVRVAQNRRRAMTAIGAGDMPLASLKQVHSADVIALIEPPAPDAWPEADGLVTNQTGIGLGILTADCTPILFADPQAGVIGACHAGWKGAVGGIIANSVDAMKALGARPERIVAAIGPTISGKNYEVGPDFAAELLAIDGAAKPHIFVPQGSSREHFDLPGYVTAQLYRTGITKVEIAGSCTYESPKRYFSHRHTTHHATPAGRQISIIALG